MVTAYLEIAEIQALNRQPMHMKDWIERLDDFIRITGKNILSNAGSISHELALIKANAEYEKYKEQSQIEMSEVEKHFIGYLESNTKKVSNKPIVTKDKKKTINLFSELRVDYRPGYRCTIRYTAKRLLYFCRDFDLAF